MALLTTIYYKNRQVFLEDATTMDMAFGFHENALDEIMDDDINERPF